MGTRGLAPRVALGGAVAIAFQATAGEAFLHSASGGRAAAQLARSTVQPLRSELSGAATAAPAHEGDASPSSWPRVRDCGAVLAVAAVAAARRGRGRGRGAGRLARSATGKKLCIPSLSSSGHQKQICLPELTEEDRKEIAAGNQVRKQEREGNQGWGFVVGDVDAPPSLVLDVLSAFEDYADVIPVVRKAEVTSRSVSPEGHDTAKCDYKISKFWLNVSALQSVTPDDGLVHFELDPSATGCILQEATGFWKVAPVPGGVGTRVWLCVSLRACKWLPTRLVDYAAERALRRATQWLKPHVERAWRDERTERQRAAWRCTPEPGPRDVRRLVPSPHMHSVSPGLA